MTEIQQGANRAIIPAVTAASTEPPKKMLLLIPFHNFHGAAGNIPPSLCQFHHSVAHSIAMASAATAAFQPLARFLDFLYQTCYLSQASRKIAAHAPARLS